MDGDRTEKAESLFGEGFNCAQAVLGAFSPGLGLAREQALGVAGAFGGGMGHRGETCGAITGALMAIGLKYGKRSAGDDQARERAVSKAQEFVDRFRALHGATLCRDLVGYDFAKPGQIEEAKKSGVLTTRCPRFVRDAAEILEELL
jgi:C_GCAxxG_C_C family probable redox protein